MATKNIRLPRLPVNLSDQPQLLERYWDEAMTAIEKTFKAILDIPEIKSALENLDSVTMAAVEAVDTLNTLTAAQQRESSIANSYVTNPVNPLTAKADGTVVIADHDRVYGDSDLNPTVRIKGSTLSTGESPSSVVRVYYVAEDRTKTNPSFQYTVDPDTPMVQSGDTHSVGAVVIPDVGTRSGKGVNGPGYVEY